MSEMRAYASYFASFLISKLAERKKLENIEKIIFFGSAAKGEATKYSDMDIFVDLKKETKAMKKIISEITEEFYKSRESAIFRARKIDNSFNVIAGRLSEWKDIRNSIASTGITLWGPSEIERPSGMRHNIIFYWSAVRKNRGAFINKLYGFSSKGKKYDGLVGEYKGKRLGKSCVIMPISRREEMIKFIKKHDADAKSLEVYSE